MQDFSLKIQDLLMEGTFLDCDQNGLNRGVFLCCNYDEVNWVGKVVVQRSSLMKFYFLLLIELNPFYPFAPLRVFIQNTHQKSLDPTKPLIFLLPKPSLRKFQDRTKPPVFLTSTAQCHLKSQNIILTQCRRLHLLSLIRSN